MRKRRVLRVVAVTKSFFVKFYQYPETNSGLIKIRTWLTHRLNCNLACKVLWREENPETLEKNYRIKEEQVY